MAKKKLDPWPAGTLFVLPLPKGGYLLGLVARIEPSLRKKSRLMFCYFFGPRVSDARDIHRPIAKSPSERVYWGIVDDFALRTGRWIVVEHLHGFDSNVWPMPPFRRPQIFGGGPGWARKYFLTTYDEVKLSAKGLGVGPVLIDDKSLYPFDESAGYIAMENLVEDALNGIIH